MKLFKRRKIKRRRGKLSRTQARKLSGGKFWIMAREADEAALRAINGVTLGEKQTDAAGVVKRVKGLVVWGGCTITDDAFDTLDKYWADRYIWGPDCPDDAAKQQARRHGNSVKEFDWEQNRQEVS